MAVSRELVINNDGKELRCFINCKNMVSIFIGEENTPVTEMQYITFDKNDLIDIIKELNKIKKEL